MVQAALKPVLEPIFEAGFLPVSFGLCPVQRDAVAEMHRVDTQGYRGVLDAGIEACFGSIDHAALMDRARRRIKDKRAAGGEGVPQSRCPVTEQSQRRAACVSQTRAAGSAAEHRMSCIVSRSPAVISRVRAALRGAPIRYGEVTADADLLRPAGVSPCQVPVGSGTRAATASPLWTRKVRVSSKYRVTLVASWEQ